MGHCPHIDCCSDSVCTLTNTGSKCGEDEQRGDRTSHTTTGNLVPIFCWVIGADEYE